MSEIKLILLNLLTLTILFVVGFGLIGIPRTSRASAIDIFSLPRNSDAYVEISTEQLASVLDRKNFILINVHRPYEGELPATDMFVPYYELEQHLDELPVNKAARIVIYCRSGMMSGDVARTLAGMGYTNVASVNGGMQAWLMQNEPVVR